MYDAHACLTEMPSIKFTIMSETIVNEDIGN